MSFFIYASYFIVLFFIIVYVLYHFRTYSKCKKEIQEEFPSQFKERYFK